MDRKTAIQIRYFEPWEKQLEDIAGVGFKYVSFCFEGDAPYRFLDETFEKKTEKVRETFEKYGVKCIMTHAPCYDLLLSAELPDEAKAEEIKRCVKATKMLGADITAIHPRTYYHPDDRGLRAPRVLNDKSLEYNLISFAPAVEECVKYGVSLGIENIPMFPGWNVPLYSCYPEDHAALVDAFNSKNVCAVWDFGHSNLMGYDKAAAIQLLGGRIKGTHVHNNGGYFDLHFPPSCGSVDWKSVMGALKDTGYDGYLTLETTFDFDLAPHSYVLHLYECINAVYDKYFERRAR